MNDSIKYGGFWIRLLASTIDSALLLIIILPLIWHSYGLAYFANPAPIKGPIDFIITWLFPFAAIIFFWSFKAATPGKMACGLIIVDSYTLQQPTTQQLIIRYLGYFVSAMVFCLGFLWIAFDRRKQGWHDKMARTVVIYRRP